MAHFPLPDSQLDSFPFPTFNGTASENLVFVEDDVFGSVVDCSGSVFDRVILQNVPYSMQTGEFTVALWMRQREHHSEDNRGFQTIFSRIGSQDSVDGLSDPNQIQMLLHKGTPRSPTILRIVVRDDDDRDGQFRFVDDNQNVNISDDSWHMITITSNSGANHGIRVFVDGVLVREMKGRDALVEIASVWHLTSISVAAQTARPTVTSMATLHILHCGMWH